MATILTDMSYCYVNIRWDGHEFWT